MDTSAPLLITPGSGAGQDVASLKAWADARIGRRSAPSHLLPLTAVAQEQIDALQAYLDSLDKKTRARGLRYFENAQFTGVEPYKRGAGFHTAVIGSKLYRVKLRLQPRNPVTGD